MGGHRTDRASDPGPGSVPGRASSRTERTLRHKQSVCSHALSRALDEHGWSLEQFARACSASRSWVRRWCDDEDTATLPSAYAETARVYGGEKLIQRYRDLVQKAAAPCVAVPGLSPSRHVSRLAKLLGDVAEETEEALENDGVVDANERDRIRRAMTRLRVALDALDRDLEACG